MRVQDLPVQNVPIIGNKRGVAGHEFEEEAAEVPDVLLKRILVALDDLRRELLGGAHELVGKELFFFFQRFGQALVHDDGVAELVQHDVFGFHVPLDYVVLVHLFDAHDDFACEEAQHVSVELLQLLQMLE